MTREEKELLLKDLCERLQYKTYVKTTKGIGYIYAINTSQLIELSVANDSEYWSEVFDIDRIKPYLRPMSSMTEEEKKEFQAFHCVDGLHPYFYQQMCNLQNLENMFNWLNKKMFDYRGLIPMRLALKAPEGMYE